MAGTRNAPTVNGTETFLLVSFHLIDSDGTKRSISYIAPTATTNAAIELVASTLQEVSNASLYRIEVTEVYNASPIAGIADNAVVASAYSNVVILFKDASTQQSQEAYIPAPIEALFVTGSRNIDITNVEYDAYKDAVDALIGGAYFPNSVRYTERRQMNPKQNNAG